jgi:hypothetical protein
MLTLGITIKTCDNKHNNTQPNGPTLMLSVTNKPFMVSVAMLNVIMLSVVAPFFSSVSDEEKCFYNFDNNFNDPCYKTFYGRIKFVCKLMCFSHPH